MLDEVEIIMPEKVKLAFAVGINREEDQRSFPVWFFMGFDDYTQSLAKAFKNALNEVNEKEQGSAKYKTVTYYYEPKMIDTMTAYFKHITAAQTVLDKVINDDTKIEDRLIRNRILTKSQIIEQAEEAFLSYSIMKA